jgi:hypothetical protein
MTRVGIVLLVLAGVWGLPVPSTYVGGIGNYDVWSWGLYGWLRVYHLQAGFGFGLVGPVRHEYALGLILTVAASLLVTLFGACWALGRGPRRSGLLVFVTPAVLLVVGLWWPDVYGVHGGGGSDYRYHRGALGYLVEHRERFEPPGFPPRATGVTGRVAVDPAGLALTALASVAVLAAAGWVGRKVNRLVPGGGVIGRDQDVAPPPHADGR